MSSASTCRRGKRPASAAESADRATGYGFGSRALYSSRSFSANSISRSTDRSESRVSPISMTQPKPDSAPGRDAPFGNPVEIDDRHVDLSAADSQLEPAVAELDRQAVAELVCQRKAREFATRQRHAAAADV